MSPNLTMTDLCIFLADLSGGGAERMMLNTAAGFAERGLSVNLVLAKADGPYLATVPDTVKLTILDTPRLARSLPPLIRHLRRTRPRALMSALDDTNMVAIAAVRLARMRTRVLVSVRSNITEEANNAEHLKRRLAPYLARWIYPHADGVIAVSQGVADDLIRIGCPRARVMTIHNPVLTREVYAQLASPVDHPWFAGDAPPVVVAIGRLCPQKNFPLLIRAIAEVRTHRPVRLIILGEGPQRPGLEGLIAELGLRPHVQLPGFVGNPASYLPRAALFASSSDWEGFGNVLVEALAAGLPIVSTDCNSGPAEILAGGRYGRLTPVGDARAMAGAILEALDEQTDRERLRQRAEDFSLHKILDQYERACFPGVGRV